MAFYQKEIIMSSQSLKESQDLSHVLSTVHQVGFAGACGFYFLSTCFALPCFAQLNSEMHLANHLLYNFAILLAISEGCVLASKVPTKF